MSRKNPKTFPDGFGSETKEYQNLINACNNKKTLQTYNSGLLKFATWLTKTHKSINSWEYFFKFPSNEIEDILANYIKRLKDELGPNSVRIFMASVLKILKTNRVTINKDYLTQFYPDTVATGNATAYSLEMIQQMLQFCASKKERALLLFLAAGGVRAGVFEELRVQEVWDTEDGYKMAMIYSKYKEQYQIALTPEASQALDEYLEERKDRGEKFNNASPLFLVDGDKTCLNPMKWDSVYHVMEKLVDRAGISRTKIGKRYNIATVHGLRKFFEGALVAAGVQPYTIEKFMGHKTGLNEVYYRPTDDQLLEAYRIATPFLTISESLRKENKVKTLTEENSKLKTDNKIEEMDNKLNQMMNILANLSLTNTQTK